MWSLLLPPLATTVAVDPQALYMRAIRLPTYAPWKDPTLEAAERISLLRKAIELEPTNALFRMALCELLPPGDPGRERELKRLSQLPDPSIKRWALWALASDAFLKGDAKEALSFLRRAPSDADNALLDLEEASSLSKLGRIREALSSLREALRKRSLSVYKSPARADMERAHPHLVGTPINVLALTTRLRELAFLLINSAEAERAAKETLRLALLIAESEGVPSAPEVASQIAAEALEAFVSRADSRKKSVAKRASIEVRGAMTSARPVPKPKWADLTLSLLIFGWGRGRTASLTRWAVWLAVPALPSLLLGLALSLLVGRAAKSRRGRKNLKIATVIIILALGTTAGVKTSWNPLLPWAEREIALYERRWKEAKAEAVARRIREALEELGFSTPPVEERRSGR